MLFRNVPNKSICGSCGISVKSREICGTVSISLNFLLLARLPGTYAGHPALTWGKPASFWTFHFFFLGGGGVPPFFFYHDAWVLQINGYFKFGGDFCLFF